MSKNKFSKRLAASLIAAATIGSSGVLSSLTYLPVHAADTDNYAKLLQYSMYFYDGNMCGDDVDSASAFDWRGDCHTGDEVVGGFHDAGDHVKFGLPAGYSAATLGWGYYEFKDAYDSLGQTAHLKEITNRFCKYFKDCTVLSGDTVSKFCYQIGEGGGGNDHGYWGPPETQESIKGSRKAFWTSNGASDIAAEYAAALAVNYLNFGNAEDLKYAEALYKFSTQYNQCATDGTNGFYTSDTYEDDQAWAAGFLYLATKDDKYKSFMDNFFATGNRQWGEVYTPLGWSNAESGAAALYGEIAGDWKWANSYVSKNCTDKSTFWMPSWASWGSARTNTAMQLVAMVISKHTDNDYSDWCKAQMGMILGDNSTGKNLVVGFNGNSPKYPHHRAASGHAYTSSDEATPTWDETNGHVLVGALVGGPTSSDFSTYNDSIKDAVSNEVALDYNAAFVGAAAALYDKYKTGSLESNIPGVGATPTTTATTTATTGKTTTTAAVTTTKAAETTKAPTTVAQGDGCYTKKVNQDVVYKELPAADKMLGWSYEDLGVKAGEKVQKVEIDISTTADKIGKWQGAFGSSTTVDPDYWTQTEDMQQVIDGDSGTLVWNVDSATSDIIQTQYGGQVKVGFWWIDCNEFTIDEVRVYTDKSSSNPTTTAAVTTTKTNPTTTASQSTGNGVYEIKPGQDVVYKDLPAADKMLGWTYEELGVKAGEKVQKVEIDISTTADKIGKWQGAFGSSTTVDPDYWTQTEDMQQVIDGDSGTLVWNVDSATSDIIQTQYGGQVKVGFWWIDCNEFTIDAVRVYTDKSSTNPTTTAAVTTATTKATTKATTTTTKAATTTAAPATTAAPTTTTKLVVGNEPTMAVNNGQKIFATPGQEYAEIPLNLYNVPDTEGITVAFKTDAEGTPTLALLKDAYQLYEAADAFVNLGKWEANPKGLSWGVPSSGKQMVKSGDFVNGEVFLSLYYNIPDEETVKSIAQANNLELKQDAEHGTYYEFPLVFEREKLNNKDGKLLDWVGTNNTKISATYVDGSICIPVTGVKPTTTTAVTTTTPAGSTATTTKTELTVNGPTMAVNKGEDVVVTPGQEYAEIPLNLYNVPDTEGITVAFKTDSVGTPTLALLKDAYQLYEAADAFVNLGKWEANPKGLSWGVPSSGKQMVKSGTFADGDVFLSLYYNIPDEATVEKIAEANNLELKHNAEYGAYYEFPLVFEREKLNNKDGKLLDWVGTNNTKVNATYVDSNLIVKVTDTQTTTTTGATTTSTTTTTTTDSGIKDPTAPRMEVRGDKKNDHKIVVTPGQEYAEIPLSLYNVPDTEGITVAFKTDGVGTPTLALLKDSYQLYEAADAFVNLGKWEANPKGLSWGVPSSGKQMVKGSDFADGDVFLSLYYNIPDEATVEKIAEANNLELKQDDEYGYYYEFPLVFEREKLNNKDGKLLDWVGTNNTKINAEYVDGSLIVKMSNVTTTTTTTGTTTSTTTTTTTFDPTVPRMEVYGEENGEKKNHKVVVTPGQEYAEIPLNLYNVPDTEGITVAFKTDGEGTPTLALLKDSYQLYEAADAFVNLGKWEANPKGLSWGVPSSGKQMVKSGDFADGDVFLSLYYNIPDEATVEKIAEANGMELKHDAEYGAYYEFPLIFEREKLNNKDGKLLDWVGTNNTKINAIYVDGSIIVKMPDKTTTTTTTTGTTTTTVTTTTADSTTSGSATTTSGAATTTSGSAETTSATTGTDNTGETTTTTKGQLVPLYGDVNVNGQVTIVDVVLLNKAIAGKVTLSEQAFLNADCGNVDQVLDEHDLNALMQYLVGIVQQLPGEAK
jgi:hypothetical protein